MYQCYICVFFFQAEDGIRDGTVTGVQTCALPIFPVDILVKGMIVQSAMLASFPLCTIMPFTRMSTGICVSTCTKVRERSEERRVGSGQRDHECKSQF